MVATLYYTPSSCSAASFICASTAGLPIKTVLTDIRAHTTADGGDFYKINPKGNVPALVLDDGTLLNEGAAVLQWIADQAPESNLIPAPKTSGRYLVQSALSWTGAELHMSCAPLFNPALHEHVKTHSVSHLKTKYKYLNDTVLAKNPKFLVGDHFTIADAYTYVVLSWAPYLGMDLKEYPNVEKYFEGIKALPNVVAAHERMATAPATAA